jgi:hypothetical protein
MKRFELKEFKDENIDWTLLIGREHGDFYNTDNTKHYQTWIIHPDLKDIAEQHFQTYTMSLLKQMPGQVIPNHTDGYYHFLDHNDGFTADDITRFNIFLKDWKPGHYFELEGEPITKWSAGDYVILNNKKFHCSCNIGEEPKYTCQITGILKNNH